MEQVQIERNCRMDFYHAIYEHTWLSSWDELDEISSVAKSTTQLKRNDPRTRKDRISNVEINYYNLDVIISVGYRVKSRNGITFINVQP